MAARRKVPLNQGEAREGFTLPGPFVRDRRTSAILAADGSRLVGYVTGDGPGARHVAYAANNRAAILRTLAAVEAGAGAAGLEVAGAVASILRDEAGLRAQAAAGSRLARGRPAEADGTAPEDRYFLVQGHFAGKGEDRSDPDFHLHFRSAPGRGGEVARGFATPDDARTLADTLNALDRLKEAALLLRPRPRASLPAELARTLDAAEAMCLEARGDEGRHSLLCALRRISGDKPSGTNGFRSPFLDSLGEHLTEAYPRWARRDDGSRVPTIAFVWLAWQGTEFSVEFPPEAGGEAARDEAARAIHARYAPESERAVLEVDDYEEAGRLAGGRGSDGYYRHVDEVRRRKEKARAGEFRRDGVTVTPDMIADLLPPSAVVRFTPTTKEGRAQMLRLGVDLFHLPDLAVPASAIPALAANPIAPEASRGASAMAPRPPAPPAPRELFRNSSFVVTDHGKTGVEVRFRDAGSPDGAEGAKWFLDAAAVQIREFIARPRATAARLLRDRLDIRALPLGR